MPVIFIVIGGSCGALLRYLLVKAFNSLPLLNLGKIPLSIILVNIIGSFLFGALLFFLKQLGDISENVKIFLFTGFLGSFTTYSTFIYEISLLLVEKQFLSFFLYLFISIMVPIVIMCFFITRI